MYSYWLLSVNTFCQPKSCLRLFNILRIRLFLYFPIFLLVPVAHKLANMSRVKSPFFHMVKSRIYCSASLRAASVKDRFNYLVTS